MLSPSPTGVSSETGSSTRSNSSRTRSDGKAGLLRDLLDRRVAVQLLRQLAARALHAANLLGDVHGQADRAALVGERAGDRLADPPGRVRRKLVAHLVVELLDGADQADVALLDQIEQRHAGLRVVARDRHDEAQVRTRSACASRPRRPDPCAGRARAPRPGQQPAVADLADVELQRVRAAEALVVGQELAFSGSSSSSTPRRRRAQAGARARARCGRARDRVSGMRGWSIADRFIGRRRRLALRVEVGCDPHNSAGSRPISSGSVECAASPDTAFAPRAPSIGRWPPRRCSPRSPSGAPTPSATPTARPARAVPDGRQAAHARVAAARARRGPRRTRTSCSSTSATTRRAIRRSPPTTTRSATGRWSASTTGSSSTTTSCSPATPAPASEPRMTVDSEAIFALAAHSRNDARALEELRGSMATAWLDEREPGAVFAARGVGRPLWIGEGTRRASSSPPPRPRSRSSSATAGCGSASARSRRARSSSSRTARSSAASASGPTASYARRPAAGRARPAGARALPHAARRARRRAA